MPGIPDFPRALAARWRQGSSRLVGAEAQPGAEPPAEATGSSLPGPQRRARALRLVVLGTSVGLAVAAIGVGGVRAFLEYQALADAPDRILASGKQVFQAQCATCHGDDGGRVPAAPLNAKAFLDSRGDATLFAVISEGKGAMPGWGKAHGGPLSPEQIRAVVAYLSNAAGHASSTLLAASGRDVYQAQCASCHGDRGDRIPVAPLNVKAYLDTRSDAQLLDVVAHGKGTMPSFGEKTSAKPLADDQVRAVVAYLRYSVETGLADEVTRGHAVYTDACLGCHGEKGTRVAKVVLASPDYLGRLGDDPLVQAITYGKGSMPGLQKTRGEAFDGAEVTAVVAYLKSWAGLPAGGPVRPAGPSLGSPLAGAGPISLEGAPASTVRQVRDTFYKSCAGCHGEDGNKVGKFRVASADYLGQRTDDQVVDAILKSPGHAAIAGPSSPRSLPDGDLRTIVALLRLSGGPAAKAPAPASTPAPGTAKPAAAAQATAASGDAGKGKDLFAANCAMCHGPGGDQMPGVKLMDAAFLQAQGDATLVQVITNGKGAMPTWGKAKGGSLSDDDIQNVLAYLKNAAGLSAGGPAASAGAPSAAGAVPAGTAATPAGSSGASAGPGASSAPPARQGESADAATSPDARAPPAEDPLEPVVDVTPSVGEELFQANCAMCHGQDGLKIARARLTAPEWGGRLSARSLEARIGNGVTAAGMPTFRKDRGGRLSPSQIEAIVAYVKSVAGARANGEAP